MSEGLVKSELLFHKTLIYSILHQSLDGVAVRTLAFRPEDPGSISPWTNKFQLYFFSISSFLGHQTFLFKTSNLRNHPSFRCSEVVSHKSYKRASLKAYLLLQGLSFPMPQSHLENLMSYLFTKMESFSQGKWLKEWVICTLYMDE